MPVIPQPIRHFVNKNIGYLILIGFVVVLTGLFWGIGQIQNEYAKHTWLKEFYRQADIAEQHAQELDFPNYVASTPIDGTQSKTGLRGMGSDVQYCTPAGTYHDNETNKTIYNARTCSKGVTKFYWLQTLDEAVIDRSIKQLQDQGWVINDDDPNGWIKQYILNQHQSDRGYDFTRPDGTYASLGFLIRGANGSEEWCGQTQDCKVLEKADTTHQYFIAAGIYAHKGYE